MKEAMLYERLKSGAVKCSLCAHKCVIKDSQRGKCCVRENQGGTLMSLVYGKVVTMNADPIEKKPLFHFLPGSRSLSIATVGCNFTCLHCQNSDIAQYPHEARGTAMPGTDTAPEAVVEAAFQSNCKSIAYTYTEPTVFMEYAYDCARLARDRGIKNVFVSNGFMTPESAALMAPLLDGNNIDLKGNEEFYKEVCGAHAAPVRDTIRLMKQAGVWVEVTTLLIPGLNDSDAALRDLAGFIRDVDPAIPWHVSRFHPTHKMLNRDATPLQTLARARQLGLEAGLKYVYTGNAPGELVDGGREGGGEDTFCPTCGELLIRRSGFAIRENRLQGGGCFKCQSPIEGVWEG